MNIKLLASAVLFLVVGAGFGYAIQIPQIMNVQSNASELESKTSELSKDYNALNTTYNQLRDSYDSLSADYKSLNETYLALLRQYQDLVSQYTLQNRIPHIYFDKNVYSPDAEAFWKFDVPVSIGVTVVDDNVDLNFTIVKISSSVDSREITLPEVESGVFSSSVSAVGLRLGESISNMDSFNVRYGDVVIARYFDALRGNAAMAAALFVFPIFVQDNIFVSLSAWKLFDSEGVPLVDYGGSIGIQYNPVTVSQYALANYYMYAATGNSTFRETFLVQANWLVRNVEPKGNYTVWECKFNWPDYKATNPWVSAMYQGQGISVLARAYVLTGNATYLDVSETAMNSFEVEMSSGGVRYTDSTGVWFEEVADVGIPSSKVLNGFMFALFGLYEYAYLTNSSKGYALFWEGTNTLAANIYLYDTGSWSYYDLLHRNEATLYYHKIVIDQLRRMYELTGLDIFQVYSDRFQSYIP